MQDLWADFPGEGGTSEQRGRAGGLRQRRLSEQATLMTLRAWLLQEYLWPYGTSLGNTRIFQRCYWLDALGSPGTPTPIISSPFPNATETSQKRQRKKASTEAPSLPPALLPITEIAQQLVQLERPIALSGFVLDK